MNTRHSLHSHICDALNLFKALKKRRRKMPKLQQHTFTWNRNKQQQQKTNESETKVQETNLK